MAEVLDIRRGLLASVLYVGLVACNDVPKRAKDQWPLSPAQLGMAKAHAHDIGEAAYRRTCIACHGADGRGNGGKTAADFSAVGGPLEKPDNELLQAILDGKQGSIGVMPPHRALLTQAEATSVMTYVRRTYGTSAPPR